jgi:hypothetical protein
MDKLGLSMAQRVECQTNKQGDLNSNPGTAKKKKVKIKEKLIN